MVRVRLLVSTALAGGCLAGSALAAEAAPGSFQIAQATSSQSDPQSTERLGASGPPVLTNAAPDSASARQSALTGANATTNPEATGNADRGNLLGEVVVTAEKREQRLQQVPAAITAFTSEKRDLIGIISVIDQTNFTPGLTYTAGNDRLSLRGVGRLTNAHTADSGTAIYSDGVFTTSTVEAGKSPLFVERTEILRGPQGTLYGRNAIGGAYNVISRHPSKKFSGEARVTIGNFESYRFDGTVSVPLTEHLRTKFSLSENYVGEGFSHNYVNGRTEAGNRDEQFYEFQLEGEIGKLDFWASFSKNIWTNSAPPGTASGGSFAPPNTTPGTGTFPSATFAFGGALNPVFLGPYAGNPVLITGDLRGFQRDVDFKNTLHDNEIFRTNLTYHLPAFDLKYIGGWLRYDYKYVDDTDGTSVQSYRVPIISDPTLPTGARTCSRVPGCVPATVFFGNYNTYEEDEEFYSHEFNIASTWDNPLQYIVGAYYYHEKFQYPQNVYAPNQPQVKTPLLTDGKTPAAPNPLGLYAHTNNFAKVESKAVFAQIDYKLTDAVKLTAGLRYTRDDKAVTEEARFIQYGGATTVSGVVYPSLAVNGSLQPAIDITVATLGTPSAAALAAGFTQRGLVAPATIDPVTGLARRDLKDSSDAVTGTLGLEWSPDRKTLVYGKYSHGYKAFGFNTAVASAFSPFPYSAPEEMDAFEIGLKKDWTRRLQTNVTGFFDFYYNAQVPLSIQQGTSPAFSIFYNVPTSVIQGIELETIWRPIDRLNILFTYGYLDSHVSEACCLSDGNDPSALAPGANPAGASSQGAIDAITLQPTRGQDLAGQQLPLSPKHKVALNANYSYPLGNFGDLIGSVSYIWRGEQYSSFFNRYYNYIPSRDQIDARVTFKDAKNRFTVIGYVRNLTNNEDFSTLAGTRSSTGVVYQTYTLLDPRTFGIEIQARF